MDSVRKAKTILDLCINEYFTRTPNPDEWQYLKMKYPEIVDLLETVDKLLFEGLAEAAE